MKDDFLDIDYNNIYMDNTTNIEFNNSYSENNNIYNYSNLYKETEVSNNDIFYINSINTEFIEIKNKNIFEKYDNYDQNNNNLIYNDIHKEIYKDTLNYENLNIEKNKNLNIEKNKNLNNDFNKNLKNNIDYIIPKKIGMQSNKIKKNNDNKDLLFDFVKKYIKHNKNIGTIVIPLVKYMKKNNFLYKNFLIFITLLDI